MYSVIRVVLSSNITVVALWSVFTILLIIAADYFSICIMGNFEYSTFFVPYSRTPLQKGVSIIVHFTGNGVDIQTQS